MIHRGLLFWSVAAVATAVGLFTVKYKVQDLEEKIDRTNQKIIESQQATHILRVEWAHLNEAERIESLAQKHLKLEQAGIKQVVRLDALKTDANPQQRRDPPLPSPPRTGNDVPSSSIARWWSRRSGGRQPLAGLRTPFRAFTTGSTTPPRPALIQEPATSGPVGDGQVAATSIDEILSKKRRGTSVRLWRKSGSPEPAAATPAAAGARYGSEKERLKGDVQETARQRLVVDLGHLRHGVLRGRRCAWATSRCCATAPSRPSAWRRAAARSSRSAPTSSTATASCSRPRCR